jgi:hypothetical protein
MPTEFQIPSYRTGAQMLLVEIISHLYGHVAIDHETTALVRNSQVMQSSSKFILPSSISRGINFHVLERPRDILYCRIPAQFFHDSEGLGRNGIVHHDQVSDAYVAVQVAFLD